jgi:hypothetical protein
LSNKEFTNNIDDDMVYLMIERSKTPDTIKKTLKSLGFNVDRVMGLDGETAEV